ncbi:MAG: CAP domain-containing protein [Isosphaeraceae bacterium]
MSHHVERRAFLGQVAFWPLFARRVTMTPTYYYTNGTLPPGYTYVTEQPVQYVTQPAETVQAAAPVDAQVQQVAAEAPAEVAAPVEAPAQPVAYDYGDGGVLAAMNAIRASAGIHALAYDPGLSASAYGVAANCAARNALIHSNLGMENLAMAPAPVSAANMWLNSPGHRANMLSGATRVGIGLASNGSYWYVAAIFSA